MCLFVSSMTGGEMEEEMMATTVGAAGTITIVVSLNLFSWLLYEDLVVHATKWCKILPRPRFYDLLMYYIATP